MPERGDYCELERSHSCGKSQWCICPCHQTARRTLTVTPTATGGTRYCPSCSKAPKVGDQFCRVDGSKLMEGKQCQCGAPADPNDTFCGACGNKFGVAATPILELPEEEVKKLEEWARSRSSDVETPVTEIH